LDLAVKINLGTPADLPDAGDAWRDFQASPIRQRVERNFAWNRWPWADQRHFASQHVKKLRQLIQRISSEKLANGRNAWIILDLERDSIFVVISREQFLEAGFRIHTHRAEFVHIELASKLPNPSLPENHRAPIEFDQERDDKKHRRKQNDRGHTPNDIHQALEYGRSRDHPSPKDPFRMRSHAHAATSQGLLQRHKPFGNKFHRINLWSHHKQ
jgi:hypothetical protein